MAGPISQSESDVIYRRLIAVSTRLRDIDEEVTRLKTENTTFDFATNLDEPTLAGIPSPISKAEMLAFVTGPMFDYSDFFANLTVLFDGTSGGTDRRDKMNPLLLVEPLV